MVFFQELKIRKYHLRVHTCASESLHCNVYAEPCFSIIFGQRHHVLVREAKENFTLGVEKENTRKTLKRLKTKRGGLAQLCLLTVMACEAFQTKNNCKKAPDEAMRSLCKRGKQMETHLFWRVKIESNSTGTGE